MVGRKMFTVDSVGELLVGYGYMQPEQMEELKRQVPHLRRRLEKQYASESYALGNRRIQILPPELIAAMKIPLAHDSSHVITEDLIYELLARVDGMRYIKIDPLKLDAKVVTGAFSRPFARRHYAVPIEENETELYVAVANPYDIEFFENLNRVTDKKVVPVMTSKADILRVITEVYGFRKSVSDAEQYIEEGVDLANLEQFFKLQNLDQIEENDQHIVNAVDYILHYAFEQRASDIHIEPKRDYSRIRFRIDGVLQNIYTIPKKIHPPVVSRIKAMSRLDIAERRRPQDGRMKMGMDHREIEIRISTVPTAFGEKAVLRIFDSDQLLKDLDSLGFNSESLEQYKQGVTQPTGLVLVTGPTGSGKTTTLYSTLRLLAGPHVNITTIEDPIEMVIDSFNQIAVQRRINLDFVSALKYILRQDPDIIMVGEIRDSETAENALQAALTGHLVFSTMHTNDSVSTIARLGELGIRPYLVASTLNMVIAQRLVRTICPECKMETYLGEEEIHALGLKLPEGTQRLKSWYGDGCVKCRHTGLYGRTGLFEVLTVTDKFRRLIKQEADSRELYKIAKQDGLVTLKEAAIQKLANGSTSYDEIRRVLA